MLASGHSFFGRLGSQYRSGSTELASLLRKSLPKSQQVRLALLDSLIDLQQSTARLKAQGALGSEVLGSLWQGEATDFGALSEAATWLGRLLEMAVGVNVPSAVGLRRHEPGKLQDLGKRVSDCADNARTLMQELLRVLDVDLAAVFGGTRIEEVPFANLHARARVWLDNIDRLDEWSRLRSADQALRHAAGDEIADAVAVGTLAPDQIRSTIRYVHAEAIYRTFAAGEAWATRLTAADKAEFVGGFREREKTRRGAIAQLIRGQHLAGLPRGGMGAMGIVRAEIGKRRGHKPIRRLIAEAGPVVQQIKPILLMSPISVAQFLPAGVMDFDLLVIDEASQVRPEDALGAIARAKQIVVVGDKKQLPPTSFFDRVISDTVEEEPDEEHEIPPVQVTGATELESILTLCEARGLTSRMLRWHYRSRHPSLIEVSNEVFYSENGGGLILFPSPSATREKDGLTLRRVNGAYDRGGKRHNVLEADAVAQAVAEHATRSPTRSLGVVTFSTAQRDTIAERLAVLRLQHEALNLFMREGVTEEFFVKNIENVQGDERDVILVSVGYGPRVAGNRLDSMAFGPVSTEGGERRLNVLFTRARYRTEVFVSFDSADINLERSRSVGARVLKRFLHYAETGSDHQPVVPDADPDSDFEVAVAAVIRGLGYRVDHQVGSAGFRIDLGVRRPDDEGRYMLAVECDGAAYHSAVWARERDRLRQEVLEGLGWRFHRVWSTDWFHRRTEETRRLEAALLMALNDKDVDVEEPDEAPDGEGSEDVWETNPEEDGTPGDLPDYTMADFPVLLTTEPHEVPISAMAPIVSKIVDIEGPVHAEEIARRVAALFGKHKAGSRIVASVRSALAYLKRTNPELLEEDGFWLNANQRASVPLRNRSRAPLSLRKASLLPPMEIAAAIMEVLRQNGALSWEELPRAVAILFGFQRTGPEFRPAVLPVIETMLHAEELLDGPGGLQLANERNAAGEPRS
jgi:very-short-patch-repair endonuclease